MHPKYKSLLIRVLIIIGIDFVLLSAFTLWMHTNADESILEHLLLLAIFVINIGFAVASKFAFKKLYLPLILNSILAVIIFHVLFNGWYAYGEHKNFKKMRFISSGKRYELVLDRRDTSYSFFEIGADSKFMGGEYKISNDSICLTDKLNPMVIYKNSLTGFDKNKIALSNE